MAVHLPIRWSRACGVVMSEAVAWAALPGAITVSFLWRAIGVAVSGRLDPEGDLFLWVRCVAYAILAGLVSRMLFLPSSNLSESESWIRLTAIAISLAIYFVLNRSLIIGILAGIGTFLALQYLWGAG